MPDKNMELWNKVCRTDPEHTKHVNQRGGFTAIDAMYQIQEATKVFGPVGKGWGWDFELSYPSNDTVVAIVELWHTDRTYTVKQVGQKSLNNNRGSDEDAVKKAVTDGLTKCLSYLGFNADVFLGMFDDNKYVEESTKIFMEKKKPDELKEFEEWLNTTENLEDLIEGYSKRRSALIKLSTRFKREVQVVKGKYDLKLNNLKEKEDNNVIAKSG